MQPEVILIALVEVLHRKERERDGECHLHLCINPKNGTPSQNSGISHTLCHQVQKIKVFWSQTILKHHILVILLSFVSFLICRIEIIVHASKSCFGGQIIHS